VLTCTLELRQAGSGVAGLEFVLRNTGQCPTVVRYFQPFVDFDLIADAPDGPVRVVQPALEISLRPVTLTIEPGEETAIQSPIRLGFDPDVPPSGGTDATRWSLVRNPSPVRLTVTLRVSGADLPPCETLFDPAVFT